MRRNRTLYRVDSELGRVEFSTYRVEDAQGRVRFDSARELFRALHGKQQYLTRGFQELAFVYGVVQRSYRTTAAWLNWVRGQSESEGTPLRTLQQISEAEGRRVQQALVQRTEEVLQDVQELPGHTEAPSAEAGSAGGEAAEPQGALLEEGCVAAAQRRVLAGAALSEAQQQKVRANPVRYEARALSTMISLDEVGVKKQKAQRGRGPAPEGSAVASPQGRAGEPAARRARLRVQTTVAHLEGGGGRYVLSGPGIDAVLRMVWAFLLAHATDLPQGRLVVFLDGQRSLHAAVQLLLAATGRLQVILDWYHLEKKCAEELSRALKGRQIRNAVLEQLTRWLWYGLVEEAVGCLRAIDAHQIKEAQVLETLIASLERKRAIIPCYAVRKELGLRNSSNVGEKYNDLIVSARQKHNGMSWSAEGSAALAALTTLVVNKEHAQWFSTGTLRFAPAA